jgi:enolase
MIVPAGRPSFAEALRAGAETYHALAALLEEAGLSSAVGDEGGYAPSLESNETAVKLVLEAIERAGYTPGEDIVLALDPASTEFYEGGKYVFKGEGTTRSGAEMVSMYADWVREYPIISIEDGLAEDDWETWKALTDKIGATTQLVGDDLFVTNTSSPTSCTVRPSAAVSLCQPGQSPSARPSSIEMIGYCRVQSSYIRIMSSLDLMPSPDFFRL